MLVGNKKNMLKKAIPWHVSEKGKEKGMPAAEICKRKNNKFMTNLDKQAMSQMEMQGSNH